MARITQRLVDKQFQWSNECWRKAILEVYSDELTVAHNVWSVNELTALLTNHRRDWRPEVHKVYLERLVELPTDQIEIIIETYNKGKFPRSPLTIDVLTSELLERSINSETKGQRE